MALTQISTQGIKDGTITGTDLATNVDLVDNQKLRLGAGNDLEIYHDGSNSRIVEGGTGSLVLQTSKLNVLNAAGTESMLAAIENGAVELYHNNSKKFETTSGGCLLNGDLTITDDLTVQDNLLMGDTDKIAMGDSSDLEIYHDGSQSYVANSTGNLNISSGAAITLKTNTSEAAVICNNNGSVDLYYDNSKKFETTSAGGTLTGNFQNNGQIQANLQGGINAQTNAALVITSSTNNAMRANFLLEDDYTSGRGALAINVTEAGVTNDRDLMLQRSGGNLGIRCTPTTNFEVSGTSLFNNNVRHVDNAKAQFGTGDDLQIYHDGTSSLIQSPSHPIAYYSNTRHHFLNGDGSENMAVFVADGQCELYHNGTKKFETTSSGVSITNPSGVGTAQITGFEGNGAKVVLIADEGDDNGDTWELQSHATSNNLNFRNDSTGSSVVKWNLTTDGDVTQTGHLDLPDNKQLRFGNGDDLKLYHDGNNSFIENAGTGSLNLYGDDVGILNKAKSEFKANFITNGAVELFYDGSKKFETNSSGVKVFGQLIQERSSARAIALNRLGSAGQMVLFDFQGTKCGEILVDTNSTSYITNGSDKSLKKNFQSWSENVLNLFKNINPQEFHFNNQQDTDKKHKGYIAQDMVDSFPEAYPKDDEGKYAFNPSGMVVYLMKAIQELEAEVAALKAG